MDRQASGDTIAQEDAQVCAWFCDLWVAQEMLL